MTPGTSYSPPPAFGRFRLLHQIGAGVLGPVFRTHDPEGDRLVAVKAFVLDVTPEQAATLSAELQRIVDLGLAHPHIAQALSTGVEDGVAYLAQQYVAGESLDAAIRQYGPAPTADGARLIAHVADALDAAARAGVFHGVLHPRDILVTPGETHLTGLGVSMALERIGQHGPIRRPYAAPEREAGGEWGAAADVFALGVIAYEVLTGRRALPGTDQPMPALGDVRAHDPAALRELLESAIDPDPDRRPAHAGGFAAALTAALAETGAVSVSSERGGGHRRKARPRVATLPGLEDPLLTPDVPQPAASRRVTPAPPLAEADEAAREPEPESAAPAEPIVGPVTLPEPSPAPDAGLLHEAEQVAEPAPPEPADADGFAARGLADQDDLRITFTPNPNQLAAAGFTPDLRAFAEEVASTTGPAHPAQKQAAPPLDDLRDPGSLSEEPPIPRALDPISAVPSARPPRRYEPSHATARDRPALPIVLAAAAGVLIGLLAGYEMGARWGGKTPPPAAASTAASGSDATAVASRAATTPPAGTREAPAPVRATPQAPRPAGVKTAPPAAPAATKPPKAAAAPPVGSSVITVRSTPASADLFIDGRRVGVTPKTIRELPPGSYTIRVTRPGYLPRETVVAVTADTRTRRVSFDLRRVPPTVRPVATPSAPASPRAATPAPVAVATAISCETRPPGARVLLDGRDVGGTPIAVPGLAPGAHSVTFQLAGFRPWSTSITLAAGQRLRVAASLERNPAR